MKLLRYIIIIVFLSPVAWANQSASGWCEYGNQTVKTSGIVSLTKVQASYPSCTVTVYNTGTVTLATIYSDNAITPTPLANPFTAAANGSWTFYAANGQYDVVLSGGGFPTPFTIPNVGLTDPLNLVPVFNIRDYGAKQDCVTDDTGAVQTTINKAAAINGSIVLIPYNTNCTIVSNLIVSTPMTIDGSFGQNARLKQKTGSTGAIIAVQPGAVLDPENFLYGVEIKNLYLDCNLRQVGSIGLSLSTVEQSSFHDLTIQSCEVSSVKALTSVRENLIYNIHTRFSGNKNTPSCDFDFAEHTNPALDPHNGLYMNNIFSVYSYGDHFCFDTAAGNASLVRQVSMSNIFSHGVLPGINTGGNAAPDATQQTSQHFKIGSMQTLRVDKAILNVTGTGVPFISIATGLDGVPTDIRFSGLYSAGRYASTGTQQCIVVTSSGTDVFVSNSHLDGCATSSIVSSAGTLVNLGTNNWFATSPSISGTVLGAVNWMNPVGDPQNYLCVGGCTKALAPIQVGTDLSVVGANGAIGFNIYPSTAPSGWSYLTSNYGSLLTQNYSTQSLHIYGVNTGVAGAAATLLDVVDFKQNGETNFYGALRLSGNVLISNVAPTIAAGFGTGATIATNNGTAAFSIDVGTTSAATGTINLPSATNGWNCTCNDITTFNTTQFMCRHMSTTINQVQIGNFSNVAVGAAWLNHDIVNVSCFAR